LRPAIATDGRALDIDVIGVRKGFGAHPALLGVDLRIRRGELVALLGPSGSGKTTLLRVIAGLEIPDSGKVTMGGQETANVSIQNRGVGFVFQNYALFKHMTVFDNIAYGLVIRPAVRRLPKAQIRERVSSLLELVQLGGLERRYPAQLSGGQRQRVALARALAIEPKVLLLDEPFGALDAKVRKDLRRWLREIHRKTGQTTIFVTHDQDEALELAERVAILNKGRIEQVGSPDDIYDRPATAFVASFVGEAIALDLLIQNGRAALGAQSFKLRQHSQQDGPARLFVRPKSVRIVEPGEGDLAAIATSVRRTASGRRVEIQLAGVADLVEIELEDGKTLRPGEPIEIALDQSLLFFQSK